MLEHHVKPDDHALMFHKSDRIHKHVDALRRWGAGGELETSVIQGACTYTAAVCLSYLQDTEMGIAPSFPHPVHPVLLDRCPRTIFLLWTWCANQLIGAFREKHMQEHHVKPDDHALMFHKSGRIHKHVDAWLPNPPYRRWAAEIEPEQDDHQPVNRAGWVGG